MQPCSSGRPAAPRGEGCSRQRRAAPAACILCCLQSLQVRSHCSVTPAHASCPPHPLPSRDEGTFELSLFAEALHDALVRDAGAAILAELYKRRCVGRAPLLFKAASACRTQGQPPFRAPERLVLICAGVASKVAEGSTSPPTPALPRRDATVKRREERKRKREADAGVGPLVLLLLE